MDARIRPPATQIYGTSMFLVVRGQSGLRYTPRESERVQSRHCLLIKLIPPHTCNKGKVLRVAMTMVQYSLSVASDQGCEQGC